MKLLLVTLLFSNIAFATNCYKELCTNDVVRDIYGWKGSVNSFNAQTDMVEVILHHNGFGYEFPYKELGKQVFCHKEFCTNQERLDQYGNTILIEEVYTHEMIWAYNLNTDGRAIYTFSELRF